MRQEYGLKELLQGCSGNLTEKVLSSLLLEDLKNCRCLIMGGSVDDETIILAKLSILSDTLNYDMFDQRIEFVMAGPILIEQFPALTYRVEGSHYGFSGRCSTIPQVCGVDLYLSQTYTGKAGDIVRQKFTVPVAKIIKKIK